jgi:hypothetical protein
MTSTPCRGKIATYEPVEGLGTIDTEQGTTVRFGATACSGFSPKVGAEVWVMGVRKFPVIGERATLVNTTGANEPTDVSERAQLRTQAKQQEYTERHELKRAAMRDAKARLLSGAPVGDWRPSLQHLAADVRRGVPAGGSGARCGPLVLQPEGLVVPWVFYDPCLWPLAQLEEYDGEPELLALFVHPGMASDIGYPVVSWRHDDNSELVAPSASELFEAIAAGETELEARCKAPTGPLAKLLDPYDSGRDTTDPIARERMLVGRLSTLSSPEQPSTMESTVRELEALYDTLGWPLHKQHLRFQVAQLDD